MQSEHITAISKTMIRVRSYFARRDYVSGETADKATHRGIVL